ncbi:PREDICTED: mitochondrial uncoupling protein 4 [Drosophila arizonae]|uniref:Mitochondrial uncoupling protein 4 n=1 Tax=Drosophila arizonae TaxID=7263 RepID=A0ABM1NTM8_DROAR|nr:PREDICTED: mitochondrial uncoupling protein 4 [Drosophila arizonae]
MNRDENDYWHMKPLQKKQFTRNIANSQEEISFKNLLMLYINTFIGANFAEGCMYSLDVGKTRMQMYGEEQKKTGGKPRKMFRTLYGIAVEEGPKALYAGFSAMVLRNFIFNSLRVMLYDIFRRPYIYVDSERQESIRIHHAFMCGSAAGCIAQALANPFDIAKVRMQMEGRRKLLGLAPRSTSFPNVLQTVYRKSGIIGMWRGVGPSCMRACLMTAGDVGAYDLCKRNLKKHLGMREGFALRLASSMVAGLVASVLSNPADVIKSRMMNQPTDDKGKGLYYKNSLDCVLKLIREEGVMNLYKGLIPCWLRLGPWSVLFWLSVEQLRVWEGQTGF